MIESNDTPAYTSQCSNTSMESSESEFILSSTSRNKIQYGPIEVRLCRKPTPTLATGRRSKSLVLTGDEAIQREKRREKNREAAKKLKEKRQLIEDELNRQIQQLENDHSNLINSLEQLQQKKRNLEQQLDNLRNDPLDELLSNDNQDMYAYIQQYSDDLDLLDKSIGNILNS